MVLWLTSMWISKWRQFRRLYIYEKWRVVSLQAKRDQLRLKWSRLFKWTLEESAGPWLLSLQQCHTAVCSTRSFWCPWLDVWRFFSTVDFSTHMGNDNGAWNVTIWTQRDDLSDLNLSSALLLDFRQTFIYMSRKTESDYWVDVFRGSLCSLRLWNLCHSSHAKGNDTPQPHC